MSRVPRLPPEFERLPGLATRELILPTAAVRVVETLADSDQTVFVRHHRTIPKSGETEWSIQRRLEARPRAEPAGEQATSYCRSQWSGCAILHRGPVCRPDAPE
jgi:hypothetical protein